MNKPRKPKSKIDVKTAADRAEARSSGVKRRISAGIDEAAAELKEAFTGEPAPDKGGRPTKYKAAYAKQAREFCKLGATDGDLANLFDVSTSTIWLWSCKYPGFSSAIKAGKGIADDRVERALYLKAVGFEMDAEKIFCHEGEITRTNYREKVAPDTAAMIFWLKNRRKKEWRDKADIEVEASASTIAQMAAMWREIHSGKPPKVPG